MTWTPERDKLIMRLYRDKVTLTKIGEQIGKSDKAVSRRLLRLSIKQDRRDSWTAEQIETLRRQHGKRTATKIGEQIGKSKNAVLGKAHRLGLSGEPYPTTRKARAKPKIPAHRKTVINISRGFQSTRTDECQWLYGEATDRNFCREPVRPGTSWCAGHYKQCVAGHWQAESAA